MDSSHEQTTSDDTKLSDLNYFDDFPVIIGEGSSSELRNLPEFADPSPFSHDTVTALLSRCLLQVSPPAHTAVQKMSSPRNCYCLSVALSKHVATQALSHP